MKNLIYVSLFLMLISCNQESEVIKLERNAEIPKKNLVDSRKPGMIPSTLNFMKSIESRVQNKDAFLDLIKEYDEKHGSQDYYNNLFELTLVEFFRNVLHLQMDFEDIQYVLVEMDSMESNLLNILNIPKIVSLTKSNYPSKYDYVKSIAKSIIQKNVSFTEEFPWNDLSVKDQRMKELQKASLKIEYLRGNTYSNLN